MLFHFRLLIAKFLPRSFWVILSNFFRLDYANVSYSQEGEDMILRRYFEYKPNGFYVDVGAHHPKRFSNTYYFYLRGWKGVNIDAMPGSMKEFSRIRSRDVNLELAISSDEKDMKYFMFDDPALNGFDLDLSERRNLNTSYRIVNTQIIKTQKLSTALEQHINSGQHIDFLSIDVEGLDYDILKSNDWKKFRPELILIEILESSFSDILSNQITQFLSENGYSIYAKSVNTVIFKFMPGEIS